MKIVFLLCAGLIMLGSAHVVYSAPSENADSATVSSWSLLVKAALGGVYDSSATLGVRSDATPDFDLLYDQPSPPHPPGDWVQVYFPHTGGSWPALFGNRFAVDIQQPVSPSWWMQVESSFGSGQLTLSWDTTGMSALPPEYAILMKDSTTQVTVNMRLKRSYAFSYGGMRSFSVTLDTASGASRLMVGPKWNLVSVPRIVSDSSAAAVFPSATSAAYLYDGAYQTASVLRTGLGYWLKFSAQEEIVIGGASLSVLPVPVLEGWNLIGSVDHPTPAPSGGVVGSQFFGYSGHYAAADTLLPGMGYWVKATSNGAIMLGSGAAAPKQRAELPPAAIPLTVTSGDQSRQTLYFLPPDELPGPSYELPPVPPAGAFDVRFSSQRYGEMYDPLAPGELVFKLLIQASHYPIRLEAGPSLQASVQMEGSTDGRSWHSLPMSVDHPVARQIQIRFAAAGFPPEGFSLEQNYPNPFNPSTVIRYALPERSVVRLTLLDLLGKTLAVLADGQEDAGFRQRELDAQKLNLPSGIYWYRLAGEGLETGRTFDAARKLVLIK